PAASAPTQSNGRNGFMRIGFGYPVRCEAGTIGRPAAFDPRSRWIRRPGFNTSRPGPAGCSPEMFAKQVPHKPYDLGADIEHAMRPVERPAIRMAESCEGVASHGRCHVRQEQAD